MSTMEHFGFEKLNRVPKQIIKDAIEEHRAKYPGQALNRNNLCAIVSWNLEKAYLPPAEDLFDEENIYEEETQEINIDISDDIIDEDENDNPNDTETDEDKKKNYNGEHILKKMGLDKTKKISRKIDFYIYKYYSQKK